MGAIHDDDLEGALIGCLEVVIGCLGDGGLSTMMTLRVR